LRGFASMVVAPRNDRRRVAHLTVFVWRLHGGDPWPTTPFVPDCAAAPAIALIVPPTNRTLPRPAATTRTGLTRLVASVACHLPELFVVRMQSGSPSLRVTFHVFVSVAVSVRRKRALLGFAASALPLAETSRQAISPETPNRSCRTATEFLPHAGRVGKFRLVRFVEYC